MQIKRVWAVYFSAVRNTREITVEIAGKLAARLQAILCEDDFTLPGAREQARTFEPDELVVFGVPTYAGRVPNKVLPFVQTLFKGNDTPAVPVVTFGNRSFDNSLNELRIELSQHGFLPVTMAAFVTPHVMSDVLGAGRPDMTDRMLLEELCMRTARYVSVAEDTAALRDLRVLPPPTEVGPYYTPLEANGEKANFLKAKPVTDTARCTGCKTCVNVCPMGSVDKDDVTLTPGICIKCHACIRKCPVGARSFTDASLRSHIEMLETNYAKRAESEVFF